MCQTINQSITRQLLDRYSFYSQSCASDASAGLFACAASACFATMLQSRCHHGSSALRLWPSPQPVMMIEDSSPTIAAQLLALLSPVHGHGKSGGPMDPSTPIHPSV